MIELRFEASDDGIARYEYCTQAILLTQKTVPLTDYDDVIETLKKLKSIGRPAKERVGGTMLYDLCEGGGTIQLERSELRCLVDFVKQPMWRPSALESIRDTIRWLEGALTPSLKLDA